MSAYRDPPRWKSDLGGADPALRRALFAATRDRPSRTEVKGIESALYLRFGNTPSRLDVGQRAAGLAPIAPLPLRAAVHLAAPASKLGAVVGKSVSVLVLSSAMLGGGYLAARSTHALRLAPSPQAVVRPQPPRPPIEPVAVSASDKAVEPLRVEASLELNADRVPPARHIDARAQAARHERQSTRSAPPAEPEEMPAATAQPPVEAAPAPPPVVVKEPTEAELLLQARRALSSDPAQALGWVREHERRFSTPSLAQEREIIAIDALRRLNRLREANARAERFHARYPSSIHGRSIESPTASAASESAPASPSLQR